MNQISALTFRKMVYQSMKLVKAHKKFINSLNVFPVPDGDTGSNMTASLTMGYQYVNKDKTNSVGDLSQDFAKGLLMGARGNSGVILSQIFRGFMQVAQNYSTLTAPVLVQALQNSTKVAYKSVMKPTEGTILSVIRIASQHVSKEYQKTHDIKKLVDTLYISSEHALEKTPDMMKLLKKSGVVDSGGQGLVFIFQAFDSVVNGKKINIPTLQPAELQNMIKRVHKHNAQTQLNPDDIKYTYCTQMTVRFGRGKEYTTKFNYSKFYNYLAKLGNSLLVANDNDVVKVHVHTEHPGKVLAWGQLFGDLTKVKVDNMHYQQETIIKKDKQKSKSKSLPKVNTAIISVVSGKGLQLLFKSLGTRICVDGGQTMNPNTQDIVKAINKCNANGVIILPNNSNIYLTAQEACKQSKIPAKVVASKTVNQGLATLLNYDPSFSLTKTYHALSDNLTEVKSGAITKATRDSNINHLNIKQGQYLGLMNNQIVCTSDNIERTANQLVQKHMLDNDSEIVTLFYGKDAKSSIANQIKKYVTKVDPDVEAEVHNGGQPVYPLLISVE